MDLSKAIEVHLDWKLKLRGAISKQDTLDADTIARDNCCDLGRWLTTEAKAKHGLKAEYLALVTKHQAFHREAGKVAKMINARQYAEATKALEAGSSYTAASSAVGVAIKAIQKIAS